MPYWLEAIRTEVPSEDLHHLKVLLKWVFDETTLSWLFIIHWINVTWLPGSTLKRGCTFSFVVNLLTWIYVPCPLGPTRTRCTTLFRRGLMTTVHMFKSKPYNGYRFVTSVLTSLLMQQKSSVDNWINFALHSNFTILHTCILLFSCLYMYLYFFFHFLKFLWIMNDKYFLLSYRYCQHWISTYQYTCCWACLSQGYKIWQNS